MVQPARVADVLADSIPGFFSRFGWEYRRTSSSEFLTGFSGERGSWDIHVKVSDLAVTFSIIPYVTRGARAPGPVLLQQILLANHELNLAKLGVNDGDEVCLSVEIPADGFEFSQFNDALTAIAYYADDFKERLDAYVKEDEDSEAQGLI